MNIVNGKTNEAPVSEARPSSRLRTALRAGAADGKYLCIVIVDADGTTGTVCEKVK